MSWTRVEKILQFKCEKIILKFWRNNDTILRNKNKNLIGIIIIMGILQTQIKNKLIKWQQFHFNSQINTTFHFHAKDIWMKLYWRYIYQTTSFHISSAWCLLDVCPFFTFLVKQWSLKFINFDAAIITNWISSTKTIVYFAKRGDVWINLSLLYFDKILTFQIESKC